MPSNATEKSSETSPVVLCLSGGGFRATFYHLGVVRLLATTGWLKKVTHVFSVSGGSILAAHMALNWESYTTSDDSEFQRVTGELISFGQSDVRGRILRRWIPFLLGRTRLLQHYLSVLYNGAKLGNLPEVPKFHFLATSLTSGQVCAFDKNQWVAIGAIGGGLNFAGVKSNYLELSRVVAASAAFPPMFPPVRIRATGLYAEEARFLSTHYLTDGGVFDNLGVAEMFHVIENIGLSPELRDRPIIIGGFNRSPSARESPERPSCVIVSDASASFDQAKGGGYPSIVSRTSRATEILMARVAQRDIDTLNREMMSNSKLQDSKLIHISIRHSPPSFEVKPGLRYETQSAVIQHEIKYVRTDLDRFDSKLIWYLMRHGYDVAAHAMRHLNKDVEIKALNPTANLPANFDMENEEKLERFIQTQQSRFRKDNLYGLLSMPFSSLGALLLLIIAFKIVYCLLRY